MAAAVRRLLVGLTATLAALVWVLVPSAASAHSLESSTISTHVTEDGADATITIAAETLAEALGTADTSSTDVGEYAEAVTAYLAEHLTVTSADGTVWSETYGEVTRETVEGIDSISVDVTFGTGSSDTSGFVVDYDAVIEAVPSHEAVVVLTDAAGDVSTAGVITSGDPTLAVGDAGEHVASGVLDMVGYGFHHVLGAPTTCCSCSPCC